MAARQQEVIRARNTLAVARAQLNTAMGVPLDSPFQIVDALAERTLPARCSEKSRSRQSQIGLTCSASPPTGLKW